MAMKAPDSSYPVVGDAVPVPEGASGPNPVVNTQGKMTGFSYTGGQAGMVSIRK